MKRYEIIGCQHVRERIIFEKPEDNMKEITCHVAYVVLDDGKNTFTKRFPLPKYPSFMFALVGRTVEQDGCTWRVVLEKSEKKEEIIAI